MTEQRPTIKPMVIINPSKGGVGKTQALTGAAACLGRMGINYKALDMDLSNCAFHRLAGAELCKARTISEIPLAAEELLVQEMFNKKIDVLLLDTGDGSGKELLAWMKKDDVVNLLDQHGIETVVLHVMDSSLFCITNLIEVIETLPLARHVIVLNFGMAKTSDPEKEFRRITEHAEFLEFAGKRPVIVMPLLEDAPELEAVGIRLCDVSTSNHPIVANPILRNRVEKWLQRMTANVTSIVTEARSEGELSVEIGAPARKDEQRRTNLRQHGI